MNATSMSREGISSPLLSTSEHRSQFEHHNQSENHSQFEHHLQFEHRIQSEPLQHDEELQTEVSAVEATKGVSTHVMDKEMPREMFIQS